MTKSQPLGNFLMLVQGGVLAFALAGCSGEAESTPGASAGGAGTGTGGTAGSGAGASGGSSGTGGGSGATGGTGAASGGTGAASGGTGGSGTPAEDPLLGVFRVDVVVDGEDASKGNTTVLGKVNDGATPSAQAWITKKTEAGCKLEKPTLAFCETPCDGTAACVLNSDDSDAGTCRTYPEGKSAGMVTLTGLKLVDGGASVTLGEIAQAYQAPPGTMFAYPPFADGDPVKLTAAGGDFAAFEISTTGIKPLVLTSKNPMVDTGKPLDLAWVGAADPKASNVYIKVDISHHGGIKGMIECNVEDTGTLSIPATLMTELIGYGVAGFPTVSVIRSSTGTAKVGTGHVNFVIASAAEAPLTLAGVTSCNSDEDCAAGKTCLSDLSCSK